MEIVPEHTHTHRDNFEGTDLCKRVSHTITTATVAKEPKIMPGRTLLGMKGTNVDHMTCIFNNSPLRGTEKEP